MRTLTLQIPDNLNISEKEVALFLAAQLYDKGRLSLGQAADMVGLTKEEFMGKLGDYEISVFGETFEDIEQDLENV